VPPPGPGASAGSKHFTLAGARKRGQTAQTQESAKIAGMEWVIGLFVAVMLGLYLWSHLTAGHEVGKKVQPFVDDLFGVTPSERDSERKPPAKPRAE
jgi:hypothetical protein